MKTHPLIEHIRYRVFALLLLAAAGIVQVLLFRFYGEENLVVAFLDSAVFLSIFSVFGFFSWYTIGFLDTIGKQAGSLVLLSCLAGSHVVIFTIAPASGDWFIHSIPLRAVFCVMAWIILFQWYRNTLPGDAQEENALPPVYSEPEEPRDKDQPLIDRLSVKDGSRIHLISLEELVYIQASGDYVTLFTEDKQFLKEQTMKSLVSQLPVHFVRIHRSAIVNSNYIARIELFEKQSYRLRLKNGLYLKISAAGYKQLKESLLL